MIGGMGAAPTTANHRSAFVFKNGRVKRLGSVRPAQIALDQYPYRNSATYSSLIAASLTLGDGGGLVGAGQWSTVAVMFGKATYVLVAYAILALFLTVLTSSSSMGIAMSLAYYFVELILGRILGDLFAWFDNVSDFLIGFNTAAWMSETGVVTTEGSLFPVSDPPGELHAFLVLLAYIVVLGAAAFWLFQRRDVAGARGE